MKRALIIVAAVLLLLSQYRIPRHEVMEQRTKLFDQLCAERAQVDCSGISRGQSAETASSAEENMTEDRP